MKNLSYILLGALMMIGTTAYATSVFTSQQVGSSATNGYVLQTTGAGNASVWVSTTTLGITGGASSTFGQNFNFITGTPNYLIGTTSPLGLIMTASSTIGNGTQAGGLTISGGATTTGNAYFAGNIGIGTSTPWGKFALNLNSNDTNLNAFIIASSTSLATTTLFSISNTGALQTSLGTGCVYSTSGLLSASGACGGSGSGTVTQIIAGAGLTGGTITTSGTIALDLTNPNTWTGLQTFNKGLNTLSVTGGYSVDGTIVLNASSTTDNINIGYGAGVKQNASSQYNNLFGFNAGANITTGANNIILGSWPTIANSNLTTGSNNIIIGYNIPALSATNNNQLNIQNILWGTNNSGTAGTLSTGTFGVASSSPWATLSVQGVNGATNTTLFAVASSTQSATTTLFSVGNTGQVNGTDAATGFTGIVSPVSHLTLQTGTTTSWVSTTTGAYIATAVAPFAGTIKSAQCSTDASFLGIDIYIGTTHLTYFVASTTVGTIVFSANNTFTNGQLINMSAGTTTTSGASKAACTLNTTQTT
jgi:hypothetical protein